MTSPLCPSRLLEVWERGYKAQPWERALILLAAAHPDKDPDALAGLSIGVRDARLLALRAETFGPEVQALCNCPGCFEAVELSFNLADMMAQPPLCNDPMIFSQNGYEVRFRLPNSRDLARVAACADADSAARELFEQCLTDIRHEGEIISADNLPQAVADALASRISKAGAQSEIELDITCSACGYAWRSPFDVVAFFWSELSARAERLLREVHTLASAYGWSEEAILSLSPARRQAYLERVSG